MRVLFNGVLVNWDWVVEESGENHGETEIEQQSVESPQEVKCKGDALNISNPNQHAPGEYSRGKERRIPLQGLHCKLFTMLGSR